MNLKTKISSKFKFLGYKILQGFQWALSDRQYLKILFRIKMGKPLHLDPPVTFNEKLQWLKLYNRRDEFTRMVDKAAAKEVAASRIGKEYIIPTFAVWDSVDEIDFDALPDRFVLKTTHGGGGQGLVICRDKSTLNINEARKNLNYSLRKGDSYKWLKEWPYKNVPRKIIAEELLDDGSEHRIDDYKFNCFNGRAENVMVCFGRGTGHTKFYFFDRNWNLLRINKMGEAAPEGFTLPKPENIDLMFDLADKLSAGIPYLRVDLYNINGHPYFGEMTFFPASGFDPNYSEATDLDFGEKIDLNSSKKNNVNNYEGDAI